MKVKVNGNPPASAPAPKNYNDVPGQGRIVYAKQESVATPSTETGHVKTGEKRGMGAAMRGSSFKCA